MIDDNMLRGKITSINDKSNKLVESTLLNPTDKIIDSINNSPVQSILGERTKRKINSIDTTSKSLRKLMRLDKNYSKLSDNEKASLSLIGGLGATGLTTKAVLSNPNVKQINSSYENTISGLEKLRNKSDKVIKEEFRESKSNLKKPGTLTKIFNPKKQKQYVEKRHNLIDSKNKKLLGNKIMFDDVVKSVNESYAKRYKKAIKHARLKAGGVALIGTLASLGAYKHYKDRSKDRSKDGK